MAAPRGTFALYAGAFLTASAIPGLVESIGYNRPDGPRHAGYGVALLFIAGVRLTRGGGIGWQALLGAVLVALGGSQLALPDAASLVLPMRSSCSGSSCSRGGARRHASGSPLRSRA